ncbi:uncharacterized protein LOC113582684 isoform X2 [Electrophorus electricus]|uniref:uncharacterized protein LOC113582684 isoform X2 n=1 Tax=Electrophorus electricus TaxID=8005 RepID=UPI000F09A5B7|nr:uncharacterized protein LOC113582684 isoform X2 [Electrophorus electricus]
MTSTSVHGVGAAVAGMWRSHTVLDESDPDSSPEAPQQFRKMRSSISLNSLRMSLRKRLPLKTMQPNTNIHENPTWESIQMNQKTSAVRQMTRTAKNSIGNAYQRLQKNVASHEKCLVQTPERTTEGDECMNAHTPKQIGASRNSATPRRTPRSSSKRTTRPTCTPETSDSAVRAVRPAASRRQLVRMAALKSPFASPNTMKHRRQFDQDLDCVAKGLRKLKRLSHAFDDIIGRDDHKFKYTHIVE